MYCAVCEVQPAAWRLECCGQQAPCCSQQCAKQYHVQQMGAKLLALQDKKHDKKRLALASKQLLAVVLDPVCRVQFFTMEDKLGNGFQQLAGMRDAVWSGDFLRTEQKTSRGKKQESVLELSKLTPQQYAAVVQGFQTTARSALQSHTVTMSPVTPSMVCPADRGKVNWQEHGTELQFLLLDMLNTWRMVNDFAGPSSARMKDFLVDNIHLLADNLVRDGATAGLDDEQVERLLRVFFGK